MVINDSAGRAGSENGRKSSGNELLKSPDPEILPAEWICILAKNSDYEPIDQ
jgi:hypothetical protein